MKRNKTEFVIYSDLHYGAPTQIGIDMIFSKNTVFLGDNFDLKNTLKSNLSEVEKLRLDTINKSLSNGGIYVSGNHSLEFLELEPY